MFETYLWSSHCKYLWRWANSISCILNLASFLKNLVGFFIIIITLLTFIFLEIKISLFKSLLSEIELYYFPLSNSTQLSFSSPSTCEVCFEVYVVPGTFLHWITHRGTYSLERLIPTTSSNPLPVVLCLKLDTGNTPYTSLFECPLVWPLLQFCLYSHF